MKAILANVFKGPNGNWDLGRIMGAKCISLYSFGFLWAEIRLHQTIDWASLGMGYTAVIGGSAILIGVKDIAVAKANAVPPPPA